MKLQVNGMSCGHCVRAIEQAIQAMDSSSVVKVNLESRSVEVDTTLAPQQVADAIRSEGYEVSSIEE
jgi:copper chaperone